MAKTPKSARLSEGDHDFINRSDFNFSLEINQFVHRKRIEYLVGRCAACSVLVYEGTERTLVESSSSLHDMYDLNSTIDFELCSSCLEESQTKLAETDREDPTPEYMYKIGPVIYDAERRAMRDAEEGDYWEGLIEGPDINLTVEMLLEWAEDPGSDADPNELAGKIRQEADLEVSELDALAEWTADSTDQE